MRRAISRVYTTAVALRNWWYDRGIGVRSAGIPVVSVGNITTGGTAKTPMVMVLASLFLRWGRRVAIVARGYKRRSRGVVIVSDGKVIGASVAESGDELAVLAERLPGAVVIAAANRYAGACVAYKQFGADIVLLDDGFQHRALARSLDIVMVDAATLDARNDLLPRGTLREPLSSLRRADILCTVGVERAAVTPYAAPGALIIEASVRCCQWRTLHGESTLPPVGAVLAVSAIANPERFIAMLHNSTSLHIAEHLFWRDHHWYSQRDVENIIAHARKHSTAYIVTTEKDAVKLRSFASLFTRAGCMVKVARTSLAFSTDDSAKLETMLLNRCLER